MVSDCSYAQRAGVWVILREMVANLKVFTVCPFIEKSC
jgi:hypothetical protein